MIQNPRALVYRKYTLKYVQELMREALSPAEEAAVLLHCGVLTGEPVRFSEIAHILQLYSAEGAEEFYCQAVRKTRKAIPGSKADIRPRNRRYAETSLHSRTVHCCLAYFQ